MVMPPQPVMSVSGQHSTESLWTASQGVGVCPAANDRFRCGRGTGLRRTVGNARHNGQTADLFGWHAW